jgi:cell wall-associated NlpC family hydrolase
MTSINRLAGTLSILPPVVPDAGTLVAEQAIMHAALVGLELQAPVLAQSTRAFLAQSGMSLPAALGVPGQNPFAALSVMDPRALAALAIPPDVAASEDYFSAVEIAANLDAMYGAGASALLAHAHQLTFQVQLAFAAALHGASAPQMAGLFGQDVPGSGNLADRLVELAEVLANPASEPFDVQVAAQAADMALVRMLASAHKGDAARLRKMLQDQMGLAKPGKGAYSGQGVVGPLVNQRSREATEVKPGQFVTANSSQAGLRALDAARSQVGVRESTGNNDGIPSQRYMNGRREPWCANFVSWTFRQTGHPLPGNQRSLASVQYMEDQMKGAGKFIPRGKGTPKPGDIIFFANRGDSDRGGGRHVGIVEKVENGRVYTIEGNSGNQVARRSYPLNLARISGYGRP